MSNDKLKLIAMRVALSLIRLFQTAKRGFFALLPGLSRIGRPIGRAVVRFVVLPAYRGWLSLRFRFQKMSLPARSALMFFIANRYLLHATLGCISLTMLVLNLRGTNAYAQAVGQNSILFALAAEDRTEITEEEVRSDALPKNANYLGSATLIGVPHIDFDYSDEEPGDQMTPLIPGTIVATPINPEEEAAIPQRTKIETYVVQDNDTVGSIARRFGVNIGTILWNNKLSERQYIRPGDELIIPPMSGLIVTIKAGDTISKLAGKYDANASEILAANALQADSSLALGSQLLIPGGRPPEVLQSNTIAQTKTERPFPPSGIKKPSDLNVGNIASSRLAWPTTGHVITQYYGWRHTGVDIDGDYTSPLYAAMDGVVEKAGWNSSGYGLMVFIGHANGLKTRYGHASKLFVKAGDTVKKGQVIAMMGTTGRSTGTHLHFEVYIGTKRTNPLSYIR